MHPLHYWLYTGTSYNQNSRMTYNNKYIKKYINDLYFKFFTDQLCWRAETIKKKEQQCFISSQAIVLAINNKKL